MEWNGQDGFRWNATLKVRRKTEPKCWLAIICAKSFSRKQAIARKRLERAQDRDGLHIDMRVVAAQMKEFALPASEQKVPFPFCLFLM